MTFEAEHSRQGDRGPEPEGRSGWHFGPADAAMMAATLLLTVAVCMPVALRFRDETRRLDRTREDALDDVRRLRATLHHLEARRAARTQLRRAVDRYVADIEARPFVPWATGVREIADRRPAGAWLVQIAGDGPRFRATLAAHDLTLAGAFADSLRGSAYVDFATPPVNGDDPRTRVVSGRLAGE